LKAAVWTDAKTLVMEERPIPTPGPEEMVVRVKAAAVCGTDIRMWQQAPKQKLVLGHEVAGEIYALGERVKGYKVGDRVAVAPNMGCGICDQCVSGRTHLCPEYQALGINMDGAFQEYALIPSDAVRQGNVCQLSDDISFAEAAVAEPLSCVYNAFESYKVQAGDFVLIIGAGPIGCMHAMLAIMAGAGKVILHDLSEERLAYAKELLPGIEIYAGNELKDYIMKSTKNRGLDVCVTACPSPKAQSESLSLMAMFGRVSFFGGLPAAKQPVMLDTNLIHYKHLVVSGTSRSSLSQYRKCLRLVESGVLPIRRLITHRFSLKQINEAFQFAAAAGGMKSVIEFE